MISKRKAWAMAAVFFASVTLNAYEVSENDYEEQLTYDGDVIYLNEERYLNVTLPEPPRPPPPRNPPNPPRYPPRDPRPEPPRPRPPHPRPPHPRPRPPEPPRYPHPPRYPYPPPYTRYIRCDSINGRYHECWLGSRAVHNVWLARVHSRARCIRGYSYGVRFRSIWVDHGCRATFGVNVY